MSPIEPQPGTLPAEPSSREPRRPVWKNPFVIAFVLGIIFLTAMPILQRRFLKAPPPIRSIGTWEAALAQGGTAGSRALKGQVWLASFAAENCERECREKQEAFGRSLDHIDDVKGIALVSLFWEEESIGRSPVEP